MTLRARSVRSDLTWRLTVAVAMAGCSNGVLEVRTGATPPPGQADVDLFAEAKLIELNHQGVTTISGELTSSASVGVFNLGMIEAGTRIIVDLAGYGSNFSVGLFDDNHQTRIINHDRYGGRDPYAVLETSDPIPTLYLVITSDPTHASAGLFTATVVHTAGLSFPVSVAQDVILNFSGGEALTIGSVFIARMSPFAAVDLDPRWAALTGEMKSIVMDNLLRTYQGLNVNFYFDDDPDRPTGEVSTIHFGTEDTRNVGLASSIDYGNRAKAQQAIVYTQNFAKYIPYGYTYVDIATGFANVAAHELGHLLGLNHTDLPADVMNVSPTVDALVAPKYFVDDVALDPSVFPVGLQDGAERVLHAVGGNWLTILSARDNSAALYAELFPESGSRTAQLTAQADLNRLSASDRCPGSAKPRLAPRTPPAGPPAPEWAPGSPKMTPR